MSIKLACLNARDLRDRAKAARLLRYLLSFGRDVAVIEVMHFCEADAGVLSSDCVIDLSCGEQWE